MTINHIGVSGGKDSTALLLWAVHESGYDPKSLIVSFCDTGNEAQETYDYIQMLSEKVHPITTINPELPFYELARKKGRFPSAVARYCTEELKMKPTRIFVKTFMAQGIDVLLHAGVRAAESEDRAKLPDREFSTYFGAEVYRPLLKWTIEDVWAIHKRYDIPRNPLYDAGCKRVGCLPCIMSRKAEIANIAEKWPERIDMIEKEERTLRGGDAFSSMFAADKVPHRYKTKEVFRQAKNLVDKETDPAQESIEMDDKRLGERPAKKLMVATIRDVVRWAENDGEKDTEDFDFFEDLPACDSRYGACE
jgi:3'-phosphoadenosine 5'-phosphosulfate sulfotransferase (PAPS reductase)/FAD synthetase